MQVNNTMKSTQQARRRLWVYQSMKQQGKRSQVSAPLDLSPATLHTQPHDHQLTDPQQAGHGRQEGMQAGQTAAALLGARPQAMREDRSSVQECVRPGAGAGLNGETDPSGPCRSTGGCLYSYLDLPV